MGSGEVSTVSCRNTGLSILFSQLFWKPLKATCANCGKEKKNLSKQMQFHMHEGKGGSLNHKEADGVWNTTYFMDEGQWCLLEASPSTGHQPIQGLAIFTLIHSNIIAKQHATFQNKEIQNEHFQWQKKKNVNYILSNPHWANLDTELIYENINCWANYYFLTLVSKEGKKQMEYKN